MAEYGSTQSTTKLTSVLLLSCTPLFTLIAFSGIDSFYWVTQPYDGLRILQIASIVLLAVYAVFIPIRETSLTAKASQSLTAVLPLLIGMVIISAWRADYPARAAADAALYALMAISIWVQAKVFKQHPSFAPHIAALLAILPLLTLLFLPISLFAHMFGSTKQEWHGLFSNIRMLDDAVLPCLFLLWQRPAWLAHDAHRKFTRNKLTTFFVFTTSVLYLLAFLYDGGRSVILSIFVGLGFIILFRSDLWSRLKLPLLSMLSVGFIFSVLEIFFPDFQVRPILRTGHSGREELWLKALTLWHEQPLFGVGGNHFVTSNPWMLNGHPHNILLQFLSEYGIAALLLIAVFIPISLQIFKHRKTLPAFAIAAVIAVLVNSLFSGALVYPLSLTLGLWSIAWLVSLLPTFAINRVDSSPNAINRHNISKNTLTRYTSWHSSFKVMAVLAILSMLLIHGRDVTCIKCTSIDANNAPRFWQYGRADHLEPEVKSIKSL